MVGPQLIHQLLQEQQLVTSIEEIVTFAAAGSATGIHQGCFVVGPNLFENY